ncbi:hypothetical protein FOZ62_008792 [Perkinsus olseni]|uniref:Uncharacterized protein n=1 Tax=Perkinsus olseni TaxID=32597 RepID=A0A7J6S3S9_PEROL|nr:hypothetical protein FOZ62_008792 [Perkinsus olseni]
MQLVAVRDFGGIDNKFWANSVVHFLGKLEAGLKANPCKTMLCISYRVETDGMNEENLNSLESAKQEGESNRFMMGPPEGQSVTLEMVNRALANGCKERDEEITRLKAELERVTNELNELRTKQMMQKSDKGESSSSEVEDTNEVGAKSNGPAEDWKTVVRSTAEGDDEREKEAAPEGKNVAKGTGMERKW